MSVPRPDTQFSGRYSASVFETLRFAYGRYLWPLFGLLVLGFVGRVLLLSNANIIGFWVDRFCDPARGVQCRSVPKFFSQLSNDDFLILLTIVTTLGFVLTTLFRVAFSRLSCRAVSLMYDEVTLRTSRVPIRFFDTTPAGVIMTRFSSDYGNVFRLFGGPLAEFSVIIFDLFAMIALVAFASVYYLPLVFIIGVLNYLVYRLNRNRLRQERRDLSASRGPTIAHFAETTQGASTIRVFSRKQSFTERFQKLNSIFLGNRLSTSAASLKFNYQMNALAAFLLLITGLSGLYLVSEARISIGSIGVAFTFIALSTASLQMFFQWMSQFEEAMTGVERLDHYLRMPLEAGALLPRTTKFPTLHPKYSESELIPSVIEARRAEVRFENLHFRYASDGPLILKNIDFSVRAGERLGIVGRTGSGKSSLVQALYHLYPIEEGKIWIAGKTPRVDSSKPVSMHEIDLETYRRSIALIAQEPTVFRGTLRENLSLGQSCSDDDLWAVLERVSLRSWVETQNGGLDMRIEERGRNLSLGERQLLCMARCLLQNSPVVVLDEATSAIDPQSEEILVRATNEFFSDRTQLIIAHRLSTLENCDRILWLKNGSIHRLGPAKEILSELRNAEAQNASY